MPQYQFQFTRTTKAALPAAARDLILAATDAASTAYAPYSNFPVGAAARLADGRILTGSNHENASSPVGICAERALLAGLDMRTPECSVKELAVTYNGNLGGAPISPCGMCRQSILEVQHWQGCPIRLYLCAPGEDVIVVEDAEWLLPFAFSGDMLGG
jgi:cytidine deaminase